MPTPVLTPVELLTTTRSVRKRLDLLRPVEREVIEACLRVAQQAPTASNEQTWTLSYRDGPGYSFEAGRVVPTRRRGLLCEPRYATRAPDPGPHSPDNE